MTLDAALDFATDHYLAGNLDINISSDATAAEAEALLAPWNVRIEG